MKLTFISHSAMGSPFVVGSHHLAKALSQAGHEVLHVSAPISLAHIPLACRKPFVREKFVRWLRGGKLFGSVKDVIPFTCMPWPVARLSPKLMGLYSRLMLVTPFATVGSFGLLDTDYLIIDEPRFAGLAYGHGRAKVIYRATDLYAAMRNDATIVEAERSICAGACLIIATSARVAEHLERLSGKPVHVVTNGVEFEHFAGATAGSGIAELPGRRQDRAVYVGAFDERFGGGSLTLAVQALRDKTFILIGPGSKEFAASLGKSNVVALGPVRYELLPRILQQCAVGMLPLSAHAANDGRSPMKFYEYAAAGLCVAATATHELRRRNLPTLSLATGEEEFSSAVLQAFRHAGDGQRRAQARALAQAESWQGKAALLLDLIDRESQRGQLAPRRATVAGSPGELRA